MPPRKSRPTRDLTRRDFLRKAGAASAFGALAGTAMPVYAQAREQIVLIDWGAAYHQFFAGEFKAAFEKKYACDLVIQSMGTAEKNARLLAEAEDRGCSTWEDLEKLMRQRRARKKKRRSAWPSPVTKDTTA